MNIKPLLSSLLCLLLPLSLLLSCTSLGASSGSVSASASASLSPSDLPAWQAQSLLDAAQQSRIAALESALDAMQRESESASLPTQTPAQFSYEEQNGTAVITGFSGNVESLVIPAAINGLPVISVASYAFGGSTLRSVIISNGVQKIDWFAFYGCSSLSTVTLPNSVVSIGHAAFDGCSPSLSIHCAEGSFAMSYCKSYGIAYTVM